MAKMNSIFTDVGLGATRLASDAGWLIAPKRFAVAATAGTLTTNRTIDNMELVFFDAPITSYIRDVNSNQITFYCQIPPEKAASYKKVAELYIIAERDDDKSEFLLCLGQPTDTGRVEYDPEGSLTIRVAMSLANTPPGNVFSWRYTQATELDSHDKNEGAHQGRLPRAVLNCSINGYPNVKSSMNIKNINKVGTGTFDVNFITMMPSTNYAIASNGGGMVTIDESFPKTRSGCRIKVFNRSGVNMVLYDSSDIGLVFFDQYEYRDAINGSGGGQASGTPLTVSFTAPSSAYIGTNVAISASAKTTDGASITGWSWSLLTTDLGAILAGNGGNAVLSMPSRLDTPSADVTVRLLVTDSKGRSLAQDITILCLNQQSGGIPLGAALPWFTNVLPYGFLWGEGVPFSQAVFPELAKIYTNLRTPDIRGLVLRGVDAGRGLGGPGSVLEYQDDQLKSHNHEYYGDDGLAEFAQRVRYRGNYDADSDHSGGNPGDYLTSSTGSAETRVKALGCRWIIKAYGSVDSKDEAAISKIIDRLSEVEKALQDMQNKVNDVYNRGTAVSVAGVNDVTITAPGTYSKFIVSAVAKFSGRDGSHLRYANWGVYVNGVKVTTLNVSQRVRKGGSSGHSWVYEGNGVIFQQIWANIPKGAPVRVVYESGDYFIESQIKIDLA